MAKDRLIPCMYYVCENWPCEVGMIAIHNKRCQKCNQYIPRDKSVIIKKKNHKKYDDSEYKREIREYC